MTTARIVSATIPLTPRLAMGETVQRLEEGQVHGCKWCAVASGWTDYEGVGLPKPLYRDQRITVVREEEMNGVAPTIAGRLVVVINVHLTTIHSFTLDDLPLLSHISAISMHLLSHSPSPSSSTTHIGFSQPPFTNYLSRHLVAYAFQAEKTRWNIADAWRFGAFAWWGVEELKAEMIEVESNDRVKTSVIL